MNTFIKLIDKISELANKVAMALCLVLVVLTTEQVCARYLFEASSIGLQELEWHIFGFIFLLGMAHALKEDKHVRVDIFYERFGKRGKAIIDGLGILLLLIPATGVIIWYSYDFAYQTLTFQNPHPLDYYCASFNKESFIYTLCTPVEGLLRKTVLIGEISSDPGGLEARWIIKAAIALGYILLLLQSFALLLRNLVTIFSKEQLSGD